MAWLAVGNAWGCCGWGCWGICMGPQKLSVIQRNRVSAVQGLPKHWSEWKDSRDFQNCPLWGGPRMCMLVNLGDVYCLLVVLCSSVLKVGLLGFDGECIKLWSATCIIYRVLLSCLFQGGTSQPIGDRGNSGAMFTPAVIISRDPPSQPPPRSCRTSDIHSGSVCGREASCEVMEMTLGI